MEQQNAHKRTDGQVGEQTFRTLEMDHTTDILHGEVAQVQAILGAMAKQLRFKEAALTAQETEVAEAEGICRPCCLQCFKINLTRKLRRWKPQTCQHGCNDGEDKGPCKGRREQGEHTITQSKLCHKR